ncbi:hypothetical protein BO71DRAFT_284808, partial [Aspergillus ellipticus CBS 707.79]
PRKFAPQLVETGKRSFRQQGRQRTISHKESIPDTLTQVSKHAKRDGGLSANDFTAVLPESRYSYVNLMQRQEKRRHSFRIPDLPAIPSSCSEASDVSKSSSQPTSPPVPLCEPDLQLEATQEPPESEYSEYVLALAARSAENQLKDQALAAFPNEQVYQPVDHFAIDREEEECSNEKDLSPRTNLPPSYIHRRASSADLHWELDYMRRHKEEAEMSDRAMAGTKGTQLSHTARRLSDRPGQINVAYERWASGYRLSRTRPGKNPPMLGDDLIFPQSLSPETTICEGSNVEHIYTRSKQHHSPGLWYANHCMTDYPNHGGLWMGTCKSDMHHKFEISRSLGKLPGEEVDQGTSLPTTAFIAVCEKQPPASLAKHFRSSQHMELQVSYEKTTDRELDDEFVTQIYNYLSLGYPCVARYYDHELSKVSGISVTELRCDDLQTDAKGYVGVAEGDLKDRMVEKYGCMRWLALRLYIRQWARKQPRVTGGDGDHGAWGVCERKGSWA